MMLIIKKENYFSAFSGWIENLGVVPLLLFRAFLLLPIFVFLLARLFLVTLVLETIFQLLSVPFINYSHRDGMTVWVSHDPRHKFINLQKLQATHALVKGLMTTFFVLHTTQGITANTQSSFQRVGLPETPKEMILSKGEIRKLSFSGLKKFTVANKEVISAKVEGGQDLLIKGNSLGHSDLMIWQNGHEKPLRYQVFVLRKTHQLKLKQLEQALSHLPLNQKLLENKIFLKGEIKNSSDYLDFLRIYTLNKENLVVGELSLSSQFRKELYAKFLKRLAEDHLFEIPCRIENLFLRCKVSSELSKTLKGLENDFLIQWQEETLTHANHQYQITITLQQFENSNGHAFNFGLSKVEGKLEQVLLKNPLSLIESNPLLLKEDKIRSQTLANPILKGRLGRPMKVRIGQEIPFLQNVANGVATQEWKFAGLSLDLTLRPHSHRLLAQYKTNLSKPGEQGVSQNMQRSELLIELGENTVLFDIGFRVNEKQRQQIPLLGDIPLFGSLFSGEGKIETYKKILCLIKIEEI